MLKVDIVIYLTLNKMRKTHWFQRYNDKKFLGHSPHPYTTHRHVAPRSRPSVPCSLRFLPPLQTLQRVSITSTSLHVSRRIWRISSCAMRITTSGENRIIGLLFSRTKCTHARYTCKWSIVWPARETRRPTELNHCHHACVRVTTRKRKPHWQV